MIVVSLMPGNSFNSLYKWDLPHVDKIVHFLMYFGFSVSWCWGLERSEASRRLYLVVPAGVLLGICMEYLQQYSRDRSFEWLDALANLAGCLAGWLLWYYIFRKKGPK